MLLSSQTAETQLCKNDLLYFSGETVNGNHKRVQEKLVCMLFGYHRFAIILKSPDVLPATLPS